MSVSLTGTALFAGDSGSDIDNLQAGGFLAIVRIAALSTNMGIMAKSAGGSNSRLLSLQSTGVVRSQCGRGTASATTDAPLANFSAYALNRWLIIASTYDTAVGATLNNRIYMADLYGPLREPSSYNSRTEGSGTVGDDSAGALSAGNIAAGTQPFTQDLYAVAYFRGLPTVPTFHQVARALLAGDRSLLQQTPDLRRAYRFTDRIATIDLCGRGGRMAANATTVTLRRNPPGHRTAVDLWRYVEPGSAPTEVSTGLPRWGRRRRLMAMWW